MIAQLRKIAFLTLKAKVSAFTWALVSLLLLQPGNTRSEDLSDVEFKRLFDAAFNPDSPRAPTDIELVNKRRQESFVNLFSDLFGGNGPDAQLLEVHEDGILSRHELLVPNVKVVLPGKHDNKVIVIGAHLDQVAKRPDQVGSPHGVIDDWSGAALLIKLYEHLKLHSESHGQFHHTFVFVGFAYEESGLWGSETYVQQLLATDQLKEVKAMVNFECLGVSNLFTWDNGSTDWLEELAQAVAEDSDDVLLQRRMLTGVGADSVPFVLAKRPAITIDSLSTQDFDKIHTAKDKLDNINVENYRRAFRFAKSYLKALDELLASSPQLADKYDTLPASATGFVTSHPLQRISWEPTKASIVQSGVEFAMVDKREQCYEIFELRFRAAIKRANENWLTAARKGNAVDIAALYSNDAVILPPDEGSQSGRGAIRAYYADLFGKVGGSIDTTFTSKTLHLSKELAYETGQYGNGFSSYVVWKAVTTDNGLQAHFLLDAWRPGAASVGRFEKADVSTEQWQESAAGLHIADGVVALRENDSWVIVAVHDGRAKRTRLSDISEVSGTRVFP